MISCRSICDFCESSYDDSRTPSARMCYCMREGRRAYPDGSYSVTLSEARAAQALRTTYGAPCTEPECGAVACWSNWCRGDGCLCAGCTTAGQRDPRQSAHQPAAKNAI